MKKILSAVAALGLVAGVATTASALEFKVSGYYFVEGVNLSSADGTGLVLNDEDQGSDAYWDHEFVIKPTMTVNDKIVVKSKIYLAANNWGADDKATADGGNINVKHLFMEYKSPIGKIRVGRTSAGMWQGDFLSNDSHANRLMYFPKFGDNLTGCFFLQKSTENDGVTADSDADTDFYSGGVTYKTKDLVAAIQLDHERNATSATAMTDYTRLKGYYNQNFAKMYAEVEFAYLDGETENDVVADTDKSSLGVMADVGMKMDKLDVGMMFIYGSGDDDGAADGDVDNLGQLGEQFQPYNILTGRHTGMMVNDVQTAMASMTQAGIVSLGVHANFAVNDKLALSSALAYAKAEDEQNGWDDDYGWEIDLGMSYNLMDNLTYQVDFGYLVAGDFFEEGVAGADAEDVYTLTHRLTMEF